jgi:hypothetical protein
MCPGVVVDGPRIGEGLVGGVEILPATSEASNGIGARHVVPSLLHTLGNATECHLGDASCKKTI